MTRSLATRKKRIDKGTRVLRKGARHIFTSSGKTQKFDVETREKLLRVLSAINPNPSPRNINRVIAAAERVVSDLNIARTTDAEVGDIDEAQALRELLDCAKEMRIACDAVFGNPRLTNVLNVPLMRGVIKNWDRSKNSEEELRNSLREIIALDFFAVELA